ncbi:ATP-binding protein [Comamonas sp. BIGb0124]|uniref:ATP-binding protein n=1 Tax=Comamonas sp. BIGb0124 TaxID=2485130 RepID=UPI0013153B58|nr:ATP-binding protein [Comamonas sp. BIGb0124]
MGSRLRASAERVVRRLWPRTLFGRLFLILASGMLAAQFLTSSIWLSVRYQQQLEAPTRVMGERVADLLGLLERGQTMQDVQRIMVNERFLFALHDRPREREAVRHPRAGDVEDLLNHVLHERLPRSKAVALTGLHLRDDRGQPADWLSLLGFAGLSVDYALQIEQDSGQWLWVDARLPQGWQTQSGWAVLWDLLWRVYLVRIAIVVVLVMLAVKWVVKPLAELARAAQAVERDVAGALPLAEQGPMEVRHAAQAFNRMQQHIAVHLAERTRFLAAVSHDLRSPIARMRLRLELLDAPEIEPVKAKLRSDLSSMESLIDSTLAFIQSGQRNGPSHRIDLDSWVRSACHDWQDLGARVEVSGGTGGGQIDGYPQGLRRVLDNLIDNALRYAGNARVELARVGSQAEISVVDDGPGIDPELLAQVRLPFVRGEASRNPATGGHGLGLSIVEGIVTAHAGQIAIENRTDRSGLRVRVTFPLSNA